jgi:hypothetical protein
MIGRLSTPKTPMPKPRPTCDAPPADPEPVISVRPGTTEQQHAMGWARLWAVARPNTRPMLRSGAWYPVVARGEEVVLEVRHRQVKLSPHLVELRDERPRRFTVVYRGRDEENPARGTRRDLGHKYAVCPASGHRILIKGEPVYLQCPGCGYRAEIAWHETG